MQSIVEWIFYVLGQLNLLVIWFITYFQIEKHRQGRWWWWCWWWGHYCMWSTYSLPGGARPLTSLCDSAGGAAICAGGGDTEQVGLWKSRGNSGWLLCQPYFLVITALSYLVDRLIQFEDKRLEELTCWIVALHANQRKAYNNTPKQPFISPDNEANCEWHVIRRIPRVLLPWLIWIAYEIPRCYNGHANYQFFNRYMCSLVLPTPCEWQQ